MADNDATKAIAGTVTVNGEQADSIRYVRQGEGEGRTVDVTFAQGDTVIDTVRGTRSGDDVRALVGPENAERIDGGRDAGVLTGETLSAHDVLRWRDGSVLAGHWPDSETSDWLQRDPAAAVQVEFAVGATVPRLDFGRGRANHDAENGVDGPAREAKETGAVTINGKAATSVLYDRPDGSAGYALTWKENRRIVARMNDAIDRELVDALGQVNAEAVRDSEGKGRLVGKQLYAHEGIGAETPIRTRSPRAATATAPRDDQDQVAEAEEANSVEPAGAAREREADAETVKGKPLPAADPKILASEAEHRRRAKVLENVQAQFRVKDGVYRFQDGDRAVAFTDRGGRITTASNDARAARAVAAMADGKGWGAITVSGHAEFRREAWLEASSRGLQVRGYNPTEQDRAELKERAAKRQPNVAERTASTSVEQNTTALDQMPATPTSPVESAPVAAKRFGAVAGTLVEHGSAPYKHDPEESTSYRVSVETERGARELWGVGLERAVTESGAQLGDVVELEPVDAKPVTVEANLRDKRGHVVGTEKVSATRRGWEMRVTERREVIDAVASEFVRTHASSDRDRERLGAAMQRSIDERARAGALPAVPVYDHRAPAERQTTTQQGAERASEHSR